MYKRIYKYDIEYNFPLILHQDALVFQKFGQFPVLMHGHQNVAPANELVVDV